MKTNRTLGILLVAISLSAYLFLQYEQHSGQHDSEAQQMPLLEQDHSLTRPNTLQADVRLLQKGVQSVLRLLPAY